MNTPVLKPAAARPLTYEEERGKPMPSFNHSIVQTNLIIALAQDHDYRICSELTLNIDGVHYTPDICVYKRTMADFRQDVTAQRDLPILAVEILSPSQSVQEVVEKAEIYLRHGVKSCWIVSPPLRTVTILLPGGREEVFHGGAATDPATGLTADLTKVFS